MPRRTRRSQQPIPALRAVAPDHHQPPQPRRPAAGSRSRRSRPGGAGSGPPAASAIGDPALIAVAHRSRAVAGAMGEYLGRRRWSHFATLTSRVELSAPALRSRVVTWVRRLERGAQQRVTWFYAVERGRAGGRLHVHVLVGGTERLPDAYLEQKWAGGDARVEAYDAGRWGAHYVAKRVGGPDDEYDMSTHFPPLATPVTPAIA